MNTTEAMHQTFNARNYSAEEVAKRFVSNRDFDALLSKRHSMLLGPRGCGKTTLLKMLTLRGLGAWKSPQAYKTRRSIPFYAIYIPTDIVWKHQLDYMAENLDVAPHFRHACSRSIIVTNVLSALIATFHDIVNLEKRKDRPAEAELCKQLIQAWKLPPCMPSLFAIEQELLMRASEISVHLNEAIDFSKSDAELRDKWPSYFHLNYLPSVELACNLFERLVLKNSKRLWALCFDELELAPDWFQREVLTQLRSSPQRFLFKVSSSPVPKILGDSEASQLHDFQLIRIWPHATKEYDDFCRSLASQVLSARFGIPVAPGDFFGPSAAYAKEDYNRGSFAWSAIKRLASFDESVALLLSNKGLLPEDPVPRDVKDRDQVLRKLKPVALYRLAYLKPDQRGGVSKRSRSVVPEIFSGEHVIYRLCDGNPRFLIFLIDRLAGEGVVKPDGTVAPLTVEKQASILTQVSSEFCAHLKSVPKAIFMKEGHSIALFDVIQELGEYFHGQICEGGASLDPATTFTVDAWIPQDLVEAFRRIVWHGGFVHVDPQENELDTKIHGKRFRLSYGLAPTFGTLLRSDKSQRFSKCSQSVAALKAPSIKDAALDLSNINEEDQLRLNLALS